MQTAIEVQRIIDISIPTDTDLHTWVTAALVDAKRSNQQSHVDPLEVLIRIVDETESAELNQRYRHRTGPTNVLSFPFVAPPPVQSSLLGDLVICAPVVTREAEEQGKKSLAHWAHIVIHGVLHLQGYDHQNEVEANAMENLERQILAKLGYPDPYITDPL